MAAEPSSPVSGRETFKAYLRKVGSGEHTSKGLSREEARHALELILDEEATPAQIGAFLIAHRIRRPEPQELTGMLDVYRQRGPKLSTTTKAISFGMPFDGRSRTAPIYPLTALVLAAAGLPVVLQGAGRMPVKYGVSSAELFSSLGVSWTGRSLEALQGCLDATNLALVHQPDHFPAAETLIPYREDLGKRPPVASLELLWTSHQGEHLLVSGFVHPPTEARAWEALKLADEPDVLTVKGLEGSTDLPISRACVTARCSNNQQQRQILHPRDHGCYGHDQLWEGLEVWSDQARAALGGQGELATALRWNAGTYLWQAGCEDSLEQGLEHARELLNSGQALNHLGAVQAALAQG